MNPLVKKEIRLLLPSWAVAVLLAMVQGITRPYDFNVAFLLFFGLTLMALTTIGRETSLNTFSSLLAQPAERLQIWKTKLSVLAVAFLTVFAIWLVAFGIAFIHSSNEDNAESYNLFITVCLIATATFTGGLWTTLLLRQLAAAFWLTLLMPAVLAGFAVAVSVQSESIETINATLAVIFAVYSVGGFFFARWLFFRAQDIGWSGGILVLPEWKWLGARAENAASTRSWRPTFALFKKELQLQQVSLFGATGLLILHISVIVWRGHHKFLPDSAGQVVTCIFWMLWLVLPMVLGSTSVAEERKLSVMESQLCLPVSRRRQFAIKGFLTLILGTVLGGVLPMLLETCAGALGAPNPMFEPENFSKSWGVVGFEACIVALAASLALISLFASTLAKNFLQAVGYAIGTFIGFTLLIPTFTSYRVAFFGPLPAYSVLPLLIAIPSVIVTLLWLAYRNFKNFRDGWPLWRRNLLGLIAAYIFITATSIALYNRVWEVFEPAEPAHGPAKFSLSNPPELRGNDGYETVHVRLPAGQIWISPPLLDRAYWNNAEPRAFWRSLFTSPLPKVIGAPQFLPGSNWASVLTSFPSDYLSRGDLDAIGVRANGSFWLATKSKTADQMGSLTQLGQDTNWSQVTMSPAGILLLKKDGTLWRWPNFLAQKWKQLSTVSLEQVGLDSKWKELSSGWPGYLRKEDGSVWTVEGGKGEISFQQETQLKPVVFQTLSFEGNSVAYVRPDGTLWLDLNENQGLHIISANHYEQVGGESNWQAVAVSYRRMVALKSDGSLWQWNLGRDPFHDSPARLGIHDDWVAITDHYGATTALAADGSLWLWPDPEYYDGYWLKLPKQPQFLSNVFYTPR